MVCCLCTPNMPHGLRYMQPMKTFRKTSRKRSHCPIFSIWHFQNRHKSDLFQCICHIWREYFANISIKHIYEKALKLRLCFTAFPKIRWDRPCCQGYFRPIERQAPHHCGLHWPNQSKYPKYNISIKVKRWLWMNGVHINTSWKKNTPCSFLNDDPYNIGNADWHPNEAKILTE